jgi:hypothetical protein
MNATVNNTLNEETPTKPIDAGTILEIEQQASAKYIPTEQEVIVSAGVATNDINTEKESIVS